jgi:hypothetical protein
VKNQTSKQGSELQLAPAPEQAAPIIIKPSPLPENRPIADNTPNDPDDLIGYLD